MSANITTKPPSQLPWKDKLFYISRDLSEEETHKLKFLLKNLIPKTELTATVKACRLFQCLEERVQIQEFDPRLLVQCLVLIGREHLAAKYFPNHDKRMQTDYLSDFRLELFKVAIELKHKDKDHLLEVFSDIPKSKAEEITTSCGLIAYLEERLIIAEHDTTQLQTALKRIGRDDLANVLVTFHGGVPPEDSQVITQPCPSISSSASSSSFTNVTDSQVITQAYPSISSSASSSSFTNVTENTPNWKMSAATASMLSMAAKSVGRIGGGNGFRVGSKYIVSASHVVKVALGFCELTPVSFDEIQEQLKRQGLDIHFTFCENLKPIPLLKIVFYLDRREQVDGDFLDITIAELKPGYSLPDPLLTFYDDLSTDTQKDIYLLGHDNQRKEIDLGKGLTLVDGPNLRTIASELYKMGILGPSDEAIFNKCGNDPRRVQFQGPFRRGGSGSPVVIVSDGKVKVFTILTHGHFYKPNVPDNLQIQEGTRMWYLKEFVKRGDIILWEDIFRGWD